MLQDWSPVFRETDVDSAYNNFLDIFVSLYNNHCPVKEYYKNNKNTKYPWLTKGIINACKKKNILYKSFIKSKTKEAELKYKVYKNKLTGVIRSSKKSYYNKALQENKNNIKGTWSILNSLIRPGSTKKTYPECFIDNNGENATCTIL